MAEARPAVLYVDDEEINLRVFEANFRPLFNVITAPSGARALELARSGEHEIALVIADQRMPQMTGAQLFEQLKTILPDAYRVMLSAFSDMAAMLDAVNRGQVGRYLVKPWVKEELQAVIAEAVRIYSLQKRLREVELRMLKSANLVAIGQISASIAHELVNPLAYIYQNVESLKRDLKELSEFVAPLLAKAPNQDIQGILEDLPHALEDIDKGVKHIRRVAEGVKAQARGVDVEETSDLKAVVDLAVRMANAEVRDRAKVQVQGEPVQVKVGPVALCQAILNLVVNAAQAMEGTGRKGQVDIRWRDAAEMVSCQVVDNGGGIPAENLEKVFEPMFTTKPAGVGTGLGLPIVRELVRGAGGDVRLTSKVGEGTTVELLLPRAPSR